MTISSYIIFSVILFIVTIVIQALVATTHYGLPTLAGPRDSLKEPSVMCGRAGRAVQNMLESLVMFMPLALLAVMTDTAGLGLTGAALYFWARVVYLPVYLLGVPWLRTLVWAVSVVGIVMLIIALLPLI